MMAAGSTRTIGDGIATLASFKELLLRTCGHSFENERSQTLTASVDRRMAVRGVGERESYYSLLLRDRDELLQLTELLTVNETYFFREPDHLNLLIDTLLPEIMVNDNGRQIRIVSAGCSSGEEPYSLAIMLRERFGVASERLFAITGVDIDSSVIAAAKLGLYGKGSFRGMEPDLLERYFEPCGAGRYQVRESVRKQVRFEVANLLGPTYPQAMQMPDIILYRNVSIYFPQQVQREIFSRLSELLADGGCLLVGASETIHHDLGILTLVQENSLFFYRKKPALIFEERRATSRFSSSRARLPGVVHKGDPVSAPKPDPRKIRTRDAAEHPSRQPMQSAPIDVRERFDVALELAHTGQHAQALDVLDAIIQQDRTFRKAYGLKGSLLLSESRYDEARIVCESILDFDSLCLEAYLMLGMVARQNGDEAGALKRFREAIYLNAACWPSHFYTAEILYSQQDFKRSRSSFEAALRILEKGSLQEHGKTFFPLSFNAEQFLTISRHKLSLLTARNA